MKKKVILAGLLCCMCLGLTACGNPLNKLPEELDENIYDTEEETTGNEAADEIIDVLTDEDEGGIDGDVLEFSVYDRDDDEDDKDQSDVYVEIVIETDEFEYTGYYIVSMEYDKEDGWEVDEFVIDDDEDCLFKPLVGADEDEDLLWSTIYYDMDWFYIDGREFYILSDNMGEFSASNSEIYEEDGEFYNTMDIDFEFIAHDGSYWVEYEVTFKYYYDAYSGYGYWDFYDCVLPTSYELR